MICAPKVIQFWNAFFMERKKGRTIKIAKTLTKNQSYNTLKICKKMIL